MTILSAQSIRALCFPPQLIPRALRPDPLITPFSERAVVRGKSYGLSACTYDCRISHDLILEPMKVALAATIEQFNFPHDICGSVLDKSSYARVFVSAFNTHFDPGFRGFATIELVNLGHETIHYITGDPLCQFKFERLDAPTELPYAGKYQDQRAAPQGTIYEDNEH